MCQLFQGTEHPYNLRSDQRFRTCHVKTVQWGTEILFLWDLRYGLLLLLI